MPQLHYRSRGRAEADVVLFVSVMKVRSLRDALPVFWHSFTVMAQIARTPGVLRADLKAEPWHRAFYTCSTWRDDDALSAFTHRGQHVRAMSRLRDRIEDAAFATVPLPAGAGYPSWSDVRAMLAGPQVVRRPATIAG